MRKEVDPNQGTLLLLESGQDQPSIKPEITDYDPAEVDPIPGLSTPVIEGWTVLYKAIKDIGRARSNQGFTRLPSHSQAVRRFADKIDEAPEEAQRLVAGTIEGGYGRQSLTHYERAQARLNDYRNKQVKRSREYNSSYHLVDDSYVSSLMPLPVGKLEHRFFYANSKPEADKQTKRRRIIGNFVRRHSV